MNSNNEGRKYFLTIKGEKVEVSEEVYREYIRPVRREQRQKREEWKCRLLSESGKHFVRCNKRCGECAYYLSGGNAIGNILSLDSLREEGVDIADESMDLERGYIEKETRREEYEAIHKAIEKLTPRQQEIVRMIYFENKTQEEVRNILGCAKSSMSEAMSRIYSTLRKFLEKNEDFFD